MTTLAVRATTQATTGTTWANTANAVDGLVGVNNATYATMTSSTSGAVATIELSGFGFSSSIASTDTLTSVDLTFRHFENNTGRFASVAYQAYDGATAIGSSNNATLVTSAATVGPATIGCTLAQLRSSTFKIRITITGAASTQSRVFSLDWVDVSVIYTINPPAITQAAYGFYADGTETGATAYTTTATLADSYDETNASNANSMGYTGGSVFTGQSFLGNGQPLGRASFYLAKLGAPAGAITVQLYAHTGTYGSGGVGTGSVLATSTTSMDASTLTTTAQWVDFDFDGTYVLANATAYVIGIAASDVGADSGDAVRYSNDSSASTHAGNGVNRNAGGTWTAPTFDVIFRVYTNNYVADTSSGDVNLQVRTRLQSTTAVAVPATDDWQLQWERNTSGTWTNVAAGGTVNAYASANLTGLADSYPAINDNSGISLYGGTGGRVSAAQSFLGTGGKLTGVGFNILKVGAPDGILTAVLYAHTGTFGAGGLPSTAPGTYLATSTTTVTETSLSTTKSMTYFDFAGTFTLVAGTPYCIGLFTTGTSTNGAYGSTVGQDNSSPTHPGNQASYINSWTTFGYDLIFEVYTSGEGRPTTNRLGAGSGSFVAGKISEDGLVDDLGWTANNYTELLYSVTLKQADLTPTDTLRFRVLRNAATTNMTYTQVPTITIGTAGPTDRTGTATGSLTVSGAASGIPEVTGTATGSLTVSGAASGVGLTPGADVVGTATGQISLSGTAAGVPGVVATATGVVAVSGTASGQKTVGATATGSLSIVGVAAGVVDVTATATGALAVAGTASGVRDTTATGTGALSLSGTATGSVSVNITGLATGQVTLNGTASGVKSITAAATGQIALAGTVTGLRAVGGTATGSLSVTGPTVGVRAVTGTATGALSVAGSATGQKSVTATATGSLTITGVATAVKTVTATATGSLSVTGAAAGVPGVVAAAVGSLSLSGTAAGVPGVVGVASAAVALSGTASAVKTVTATATGQIVFSSTALGLVEGNAVGTATGSLTVAATAVGVRGRPGAATGTLTISGIGVGVRGRPGSATGQLSLTSGAVGVRGVTATAAGVLTVVALAVATKTVHGVATGTISISGAAVGAGVSEAFVGFEIWDGATFVDGEVRLWTGAAFVGAEGVKVWDGTAFVDS